MIQKLLFLCYLTLKFPSACLASSDKLDFLCSCLAFSFRFTTSLGKNSSLESVDVSAPKKTILKNTLKNQHLYKLHRLKCWNFLHKNFDFFFAKCYQYLF